ncbi:MAG: hypothetical protein ABIS29_16680, partial [Vicinamibacterales bacterium]
GSPVFNDQWEVVALHHSGIPRKDGSGRILTRDGKVWTAAMGETAVDWVANEGVRISRILKHLQALSMSGVQATLRKQLLDADKGWRGDHSLNEMTGSAADESAFESAYESMAVRASAPDESPLEWLMSGPAN